MMQLLETSCAVCDHPALEHEDSEWPCDVWSLELVASECTCFTPRMSSPSDPVERAQSSTSASPCLSQPPSRVWAARGGHSRALTPSSLAAVCYLLLVGVLVGRVAVAF